MWDVLAGMGPLRSWLLKLVITAVEVTLVDLRPRKTHLFHLPVPSHDVPVLTH